MKEENQYLKWKDKWIPSCTFYNPLPSSSSSCNSFFIRLQCYIFWVCICVWICMNFSVTKVYRHSIISIHVWWRQAHIYNVYMDEVDRWWCIKINKRTRRMDGEVENWEKNKSFVKSPYKKKKFEKVPSIMLLKKILSSHF